MVVCIPQPRLDGAPVKLRRRESDPMLLPRPLHLILPRLHLRPQPLLAGLRLSLCLPRDP